MLRNIAVCLISVGSCIGPLRAGGIATNTPPAIAAGGFEDASTNPLLAQPAAMPGDRVREAETQERALLDRVKQQDRERQARQEIQQRKFAAKFNQLVNAMAGFAKEYNQGKGSTWPRREADKLRKAMRQLQSLEKSLGDDPTGRRHDTGAGGGIGADE
jgi:hypothetical protein